MTSRQDTKLSLLMARLIHRIIVLDRDEKSCQGVSLTQHYTIAALYRKKRLTMNELSREVHLAISTLTRIVDVLVRDGLVQRKPSPEDRRKVIAELTEKGNEKARHLRECTQRFWTDILSRIPDEKKPDLTGQVKLLLEAMESMESVCVRQKAADGGGP
ncbi:MarR family transcriptional regulator [bacterium]|nr:MarR family transcriptional regulator [bacterium]